MSLEGVPMLSRMLKAYDLPLVGAGAGLLICSNVAMASAASTINPVLALRHLVWGLMGFSVSLIIAMTNYRRWLDYAVIGYILSVCLLALVLLAGTVKLGATRWLSVFGLSLQPSEIAKITTIGTLVQVLAGQPTPLPIRRVGLSLVLLAPVALAVFLQPDLGSASIFCVIWLGMVLAAGIPRRVLLSLIVMGMVMAPCGWHVLKAYQRDRLLAFINPHADPLGAGYTIIQSTIAIGAGRLWGRGWFAGTQNQLSFLPERHSDFIFSVIGEEWGLVGSLILIGTFLILFMRIFHVAMRSTDPQARLLAVGIFSWLGYQTVVNMGMVMGLLPVVGIPLPFISYGGSAMLSGWIALGLLQSINRLR